MAVVLALLIVGWLLAFALGAQSGFDAEPAAQTTTPTATTATTTDAAATYREPASVA
ncbi:MAG: hypothetical protein AAFY72_18485 [Cyanobacteria bacterium J06649_4]